MIFKQVGHDAGRIGLDRWVVPFIRKTVLKGKDTAKQHA